MDLAEIKAAIPKLSPRDQAELDLWLQERELDSVRQAHLAELKAMLKEGLDDVAAGRVHEWNEKSLDEIRELGRKSLNARRNGQ